jgi:hypothetical protein
VAARFVRGFDTVCEAGSPLIRTLHCYYVNPCRRNWPDWLGIEEGPAPIPTTSDFTSNIYYQADGAFLTLVHFGRELDPTEVSYHNDRWERLTNRSRVFWLVYGGVAYRDHSDSPNIHYLRYPIDDLPSLAGDTTNRFKAFLNVIATEPVPASVWDTLYPPDNVQMATLLAMLMAAEYLDLKDVFERMLRDKTQLRYAYEQYSRTLTTSHRGMELGQWTKAIQSRSLGDLRTELVNVLGRQPVLIGLVPDACKEWHAARGRLVHALLERTLIPLLSLPPRSGFEDKRAQKCWRVWADEVEPQVARVLMLLPAMLPSILLTSHLNESSLIGLRDHFSSDLQIGGQRIDDIPTIVADQVKIGSAALNEFMRLPSEVNRERSLSAVTALYDNLRETPKYVVLK